MEYNFVIIPEERLYAMIEEIVAKNHFNSNPDETRVLSQSLDTQPELAKFLGVTEQTIIRWRKKKRIPWLQIGTSIRFDRAAVVKAIERK
jgi:excisionase family DNA binding protein